MEQEIIDLKNKVSDLSRMVEDATSSLENLKKELKEQDHNGFNGAAVDFRTLTGLIKVITTVADRDRAIAASVGPTSISDQIFIYYTSTGPAWSLYLYDTANKVWKSVTIA